MVQRYGGMVYPTHIHAAQGLQEKESNFPRKQNNLLVIETQKDTLEFYYITFLSCKI